ncbi:MAG: PorT family protein, partial [Alistipes sp.]|nr:PorT family protein [Alistipes sp.]
MELKRSIFAIFTAAAMLVGSSTASAQHTLSAVGGTGISTARFYPAEETRILWGAHDFGLSWRYYSPT